MFCNEVKEKLIGYIEQDLSKEEMIEIEKHLDLCPVCAREYSEMEKMDKVLSYVGRNYTLEPSKNLHPEIINQIFDKSQSKEREKIYMSKNKLLYSFIGVAAIFLILCTGIFFFIQSTQESPYL